MTNMLLNAADDYVRFGLSVIALTGKAPNVAVHRRGLYDAFHGLNTTGIRDAFEHPDTTGVGILTNHPLIVVDIDGEEGAQAWLELAGDDHLSDRWIAKTGRGLHLYFTVFRQTGTRKLAEKLDLKGHGGYVAAPPSLHPDGHRYEWLAPPVGPFLEVPDGLASRLAQLDFEEQRRLLTKQASKRVRHAPLEGGKFWPSWGFDGVIERVRSEPPGNRNAVLYWAAMTLHEDDAAEEDFEALYDAALASGLHRREVKQTMRSALRAAERGG